MNSSATPDTEPRVAAARQDPDKQDPGKLNSNNIVELIADIFERRGAESYLGEQVTMSEHMLQCALLAENESAGDALIAAALLHDIGHYTNEFPEDAAAQGIDNHHDAAGAEVLSRWFPDTITDCVRYHVAAKRYLCAVESDYFAKLSPASVDTLRLQGGPMSEAEVADFSQNPNLEAILRVRRWDEAAKVENLDTPDFAHYREVLERCVLHT